MGNNLQKIDKENVTRMIHFSFRFSLDKELASANPDYNIVFELKVKCTKNPKAPDDAVDPDVLYLNNKGKFGLLLFRKVLFSDIEGWLPINQLLL